MAGLVPTPSSSIASFAKKYAKEAPDLGIAEFAVSPHGLALPKLFPSQRFVLKVFEKEELDDTIADIEIRDQFNDKVLFNLTEKKFYEYLRADGRFSMDYDEYCRSPMTQIMLSMGRRASKSTIIAIWVSYKLHQILKHDHPQLWFGILPNDQMNITMTALGEANAQKLLAKLAGVIKGSPFFQPFLLEPPSSSSLKLWTKHDIATMKEKQIKSGAQAQTNSITITAQANSPGVRGENNIFVILEEFAHFNQASKSSREKPLDETIYESLVPSVSGFKTPDGQPFGKALVISSPKGKQGKFAEEYLQAFELGADSYTLAIAAPTWEINPLVQSAFLKAAYNKSRSTYDQEYGAKMLEGGSAWLQDLGAFYTSVRKSYDGKATTGRVDRLYFIGIDFALSNDATAVCICHYEPKWEWSAEDFVQEAFAYAEGEPEIWMPGPDGGRYVIDVIDEARAGVGLFSHRKTLLIDDVLDWIVGLYKRWPIQHGIYDQWSGEIISQLIKTRGMRRIEMVTMTEIANDSMYKLFSSLLHEGRIKLPEDKSFLRELLALRVEHRHHGMIKVEKPAGGTDDRFDAMVRAIYLAHAFVNKNYTLAGDKINFTFGSPVERTMVDMRAAHNERHLRKLQQLNHQSHLSIRNPRGMLPGKGRR